MLSQKNLFARLTASYGRSEGSGTVRDSDWEVAILENGYQRMPRTSPPSPAIENSHSPTGSPNPRRRGHSIFRTRPPPCSESFSVKVFVDRMSASRFE
jgi:hypothetical protein